METPRIRDAKPTAPATLTSEDSAIVARMREARQAIRDEIAKVIVGQEQIIDHMLVGLLCRGHILLLGVPGLGKSLMAHTLARTLDLEFRRIHHTRPRFDITGMDIIEEDPATGRRKLEFPGPIFTPPTRTTSPHATQDAGCSCRDAGARGLDQNVGGRIYPLNPPFFVVATQNPIEMEGTYPLPEAQLDRFMFNLKVKYPSLKEEKLIVKETTGTHSAPEQGPCSPAEELLRLQELVRGVPIAESVMGYAVRLVAASRPGESKEIDGIHKYFA